MSDYPTRCTLFAVDEIERDRYICLYLYSIILPVPMLNGPKREHQSFVGKSSYITYYILCLLLVILTLFTLGTE